MDYERFLYLMAELDRLSNELEGQGDAEDYGDTLLNIQCELTNLVIAKAHSDVEAKRQAEYERFKAKMSAKS